MHSNMEYLLSCQLKMFMVDSCVQRVDEEGNIDPLTGVELLAVDTEDKKKWRSKKSLKIGEECKSFIAKLDLSPASPKLRLFFKGV